MSGDNGFSPDFYYQDDNYGEVHDDRGDMIEVYPGFFIPYHVYVMDRNIMGNILEWAADVIERGGTIEFNGITFRKK